MTTSTRKGRGQRKDYKIQVGWQHYRNGKYRVVTKAKGGGTRVIQYGYGEDLTVEGIKSQAIHYFFPNEEKGILLSPTPLTCQYHEGVGTLPLFLYFFPNGNNEKGSLEQFDIALVSTAGQEIKTFLDSNDEPCSFTVYLKSNGIYASQCHFYLRTKRKEKKMFKLNGMVVNTSVNIKYFKTKQSLYSDELSEISCHSYKDCFRVSGYPDNEEYDPFTDGFLVSRIVQDDTLFLERNENEYTCPQATGKEQFVLNGPSEIYGFEMDDSSRLILGVITLAHNQNHVYNWWRNGSLFCSGLNRCVIEVTDTGEYSVTVTSNLDSCILGKSDIAKVDTYMTEGIGKNNSKSTETLSNKTSNHIQPEASATISQKEAFTSSLALAQTLHPQARELQPHPQTITLPPMPEVITSSEVLSRPHALTSLSETLTSLSSTKTIHSLQNPHEITSSDTLSERQEILSSPQTVTSASQQHIIPLLSSPEEINSQVLLQPQATMSSPSPQGITSVLLPQTTSTQSQLPSLPLPSSSQVVTADLSQRQTQATTQQATTPVSQHQTIPSLSMTQEIHSTNMSQHPEFTSLSSLQIITLLSLPQITNVLPMPDVKTSLSDSSQTLSSPSSPDMITSITNVTRSLPQQLSLSLTDSSSPQTVITSPKSELISSLPLISPVSHKDRSSCQQQKAFALVQTQQKINVALEANAQACEPSDCGPTKPKYSRSEQAECKEIQTLPSQYSPVSVPRVNLSDINMGNEIGRGGFGVVYLGRWIGTKVAVKEIVVKRMKISKPLIDRELCVHSQLRHPNIVLLMAYAIEHNRLYMVSEFIDGCTLDSCLFGCGGDVMNMSVKLQVSLKISQAVAYLHSQTPSVIHRDIKPENVLIADKFSVVKLCDMGLSKLKTMNTVMTTMALGSIQPGTPAYQAPEVLVERKSATTMTDIWSLSCTLVELMTESLIWNFAEEPVRYIFERMTVKAKPDGLLSLSTNSDINNDFCSILEQGPSYCAHARPKALEIVEHLMK